MPVIYGICKNAPQSFLLAYIGAELTVRLFYDLIFHARKRKPTTEKVLTPNVESNTHPLVNSDTNSQKKGCWTKIKKILSHIFHQDKNSQFSTIATSAYLVAFALLFYLTCLFAFRPFLETSSMSFLVFCLEQTLNTGESIHFYSIDR